MITAVYPGTFDPITHGHVDIIMRAAKLCDHLVLAVADNPGKNPFFTATERVALIENEVANNEKLSKYRSNITVHSFSGLLVEFAAQVSACAVIRGLRAVSDFEYEFQMAAMNHRLSPSVESIFVMASENHQFISSRFVKEVATLGGDISQFVSPNTQQKILAKLRP